MESKSPVLVAMGNPLLDIQVQNGEGDRDLIKIYGLKPDDAILAQEKHHSIYEKTKNLNPKYVAGGAAQNTARAAAYVLPPKSAAYIGAVGKDEYSKELTNANNREGVASYYQVVSEDTGACAVVLSEGGKNRSLVTNLSAAEKFNNSHFSSQGVKELIEGATHFYIEGYFLSHGLESALEFAEFTIAPNKDKVFAMNLSAPFIVQFFKNNVDALLPYTDYVFSNEDEARGYASSHGFKEGDDIKSIVHFIAKRGKDLRENHKQKERLGKKPPLTVVVTQGASSTIVASSSDDSAKDAKIYPVTPLKPEEIVDTNGAGDCFAGGFYGAIIAGKTLPEAVEAGHRLGQMCVKHVGPQLKWPKETIF